MYLEQVFTQILKMSMTAGWCILAVLILHLIFHKAPKNICMLCGWWWLSDCSVRFPLAHRWESSRVSRQLWGRR